MKVIEKINLFYKQANNKDEKLSILVHNFVTSCDWFLDTLLAAYSDYFRSLGNSEANKKRLESYSASIKNAKDSLFVLSKNFLQTNNVDFIEQINLLIFSAAEFSRSEELRKWYFSTNHSPNRIAHFEQIKAKSLKVKKEYTALKEYIYK